jgi:2-deoxy-D-gluconate 3-dehydrogenase
MSVSIVDRFRLDGRNALVTGASRGLGAAIARALAEAGANIVLHSSREEARTLAGEMASTCGVKTACVTADLTDPDAPRRLIERAIAAFGQIDILVNNAGVIRRAPAAGYGDAEWDEVIQVNLSSVFRLSRTAAAGMLARKSGKIINIASLLSFQGGILVPAYAAAKGAVAQLTKALANEWAADGVNVNAVAPGYMVTDNTKPLMDDPVRYQAITARIPAGRWGQPEDLAGAAVFLASAAADYVHGHVLVVDGGWMGR